MAKEVKEKDEKTIRILSNRRGDVGCADGTVIKYESVTLVTKETADWLLKSFPEYMKKVN